MQHLIKAISLAKKNGDNKRVSLGTIKLAYYYLVIGNYAQSLSKLSEAESLLKNVKAPFIEAELQKYKGIANNFSGRYEKAIEPLQKALTIYESLKDSGGIAHCYLNIGIVNMNLGNYDKSITDYSKALAVYRALGDEKNMAKAIGNIGIIYKRKKEYFRAIDYYKQSLRINEKYGFRFDMRMDLNNLGVLYEETGDYKTAMAYHTRAKEIADELKMVQYILTSEFNLAMIDYRLGDYSSTINKLQKIISVAEENGYKDILMKTYELLSNSYKQTGKFETALENRLKYETYKDSLLNEANLKKIAELQTQYETEKKDQKILLLAKERSLQANELQRQRSVKKTFILGSVLLIVLAASLLYNNRIKLKNQRILAGKNKKIDEANFKYQLSQLEMKLLRAQVNPHFLFNCMASINLMIMEGDNEKASQYLVKFSKLIRSILENSEKPSVSLQKEIEMLNTYIQLEKLRHKNFRYEIKIKNAIDKENTFIPSLLLQPFVENAIHHGIAPKDDTEEGQLKISIRQLNNEFLFCTVEDNGIGRKNAALLNANSMIKSKSMGINISRERLNLLNNSRGDHLLKIIDLKDDRRHATGTRVEINIPIVNQ